MKVESSKIETVDSPSGPHETYPMSNERTYPSEPQKPSTKEFSTAFSEYPIAASFVKEKWNQDAILYAIPDTLIMQQNLGHPGTNTGWFYMFKVGGETLEYYVYVDEGTVQGSTEAQPIIIGNPPPKDMPLPELSSMIDSLQAFEIFLNNGGSDKVSEADRGAIRMSLVNLVADGFPSWNVYYLDSTGENQIKLKINAITGDIVQTD